MKLRSKMTTFLCSSIVVIQLFSLILINSSQLVDGYYVTNDRAEECKTNMLLQASDFLLDTSVYSMYSNYTGTNSGYGFYGPNVGSEFILSFTVVDKEGNVLGKHRRPSDIIQTESKQRFDLCTYPMMMRIEQGSENKLLEDYFKVLLHQIGESIYDQYDVANKVIAEVYVHNFPTIAETVAGEVEKFNILERRIFTY